MVVSVEYRLLPENRYPEPLDDCFFALRYLMQNAHLWGIDPTRIAVAGVQMFAICVLIVNGIETCLLSVNNLSFATISYQ